MESGSDNPKLSLSAAASSRCAQEIFEEAIMTLHTGFHLDCIYVAQIDVRQLRSSPFPSSNCHPHFTNKLERSCHQPCWISEEKDYDAGDHIYYIGRYST